MVFNVIQVTGDRVVIGIGKTVTAAVNEKDLTLLKINTNIDKFLPGAYTPSDVPDRYTFVGGSTTGGAVIYDKGAFLFSHHATDPCSGRLVNAFDLVRLHLYADKDEDAKPATPTNKLPSYTAACELAVADESVAALLSKERYDNATSDFEGVQADNTDAAANWMAKLKTSTEGRIAKTTDNLLIILENDPLIKGKIAYNEFANRGVARGPLPWDPKQARRPWTDNDDAGARWYMERVYDITGKDKITDGLALYAHKNAFDDVKDYLAPLVWDGVPRLDTLLSVLKQTVMSILKLLTSRWRQDRQSWTLTKRTSTDLAWDLTPPSSATGILPMSLSVPGMPF